MNRTGNPMSVHWYIPVILHQPKSIVYCIMTGIYQSRDIVSQGTINLGTMGSRTFVRGHIASGCPVTPPWFPSVSSLSTPNMNPPWLFPLSCWRQSLTFGEGSCHQLSVAVEERSQLLLRATQWGFCPHSRKDAVFYSSSYFFCGIENKAFRPPVTIVTDCLFLLLDTDMHIYKHRSALESLFF